MKSSILFAILIIGSAQAQIKVVVSGKPISVNGETGVPEALMGVHTGNFAGLTDDLARSWGIVSSRTIEAGPSGNPVSPPASVEHVVSCWYDRYVPPLQLSNPSGWKSALETKAQTFANAAKTSTRKHHLEFWNEPYLNWSYKPGVTSDPRFFETANVKVGDRVHIKGQTQPTEHFRWAKGLWYKFTTGEVNYPVVANTWNQQLTIKNIAYPGMEGALVPGETYNAGTKNEFIAYETLRPVDPTQTSYYSARQNSAFYNEMYGVVAQKVKSLNADVKMVAGWGFRAQNDNWAAWNLMYKPLIDAHYQYIDGINEHHYGGDTRLLCAEYETIYAYASGRFNKRLRFYNTETGGYVDPQSPESIKGNSPGDLTAPQKSMHSFTYNVRDILYMVNRCPDKAFSRAVHEAQNTSGGVEQAFKFLKPMRGTLIQAECSHNDLWSVSCLNRDTLIAICFNDMAVSTSFSFQAIPPSGYQFASGERIHAVLSGETVSLKREPFTAQSTLYSENVSLGPLAARMFVFKLSGTAAVQNAVTYRQFFADSILIAVPAGQSATARIPIDQSVLSGTGSARLRYVIQNATGSESLRINDSPVTLYKGTGIRMSAIDRSKLTANNIVTVTAGSADIKLWVAGIELVSEVLPVTTGLVQSKPVARFNPRLEYSVPTRTLTIEGFSAAVLPARVEIFSLSGTRLYCKSLDSGRNRVQLTIPGACIAKVSSGSTSVIRKLHAL